MPIPERFVPYTHALLRIFVGAAYFSHGAQKILGWFGGMGGGTVDYMSRFGAAGFIELIAGTLIVIGLFTNWAAFIASGEMAVAYFWMHVPGMGPNAEFSIWWWANRGETVMVFSFVFLFLAAAGAGPWSVDAKLGKKG